MSLELLQRVTEALPYALRERIEGYGASIEESGEDIFADAQIPYDQELLTQLVFCAGIRRLWTIVDSQFSIINDSISLLRQSQTDGFTIGRRRLDLNSPEYVEIRELRNNLLTLVQKLEIEQYVTALSLRDILLMLREGEQ